MQNRLRYIDDFRRDQVTANRSPNTIRAYAGDRRAFKGEPTVANLRDHFATMVCLAPASRARKQASFSAYFECKIRIQSDSVIGFTGLRR